MPDNRPGEFSGKPGLIQSEADGHKPDVSERQYLLRQTDPSPRWVAGVEQPPDDFIEAGDRIA